MSEIHPIQAMMDGMSAAWQRERAETQMTLGNLISVLESISPKRQIVGLGKLISYRGYYCDLAFVPSDEPTTVGELLDRCRAAMGKIFEGYKGGDFVMGANTPLWVAGYGSSSCPRLMSLDLTQETVRLVTQPEPCDE